MWFFRAVTVLASGYHPRQTPKSEKNKRLYTYLQKYFKKTIRNRVVGLIQEGISCSSHLFVECYRWIAHHSTFRPSQNHRNPGRRVLPSVVRMYYFYRLFWSSGIHPSTQNTPIQRCSHTHTYLFPL